MWKSQGLGSRAARIAVRVGLLVVGSVALYFDAIDLVHFARMLAVLLLTVAAFALIERERTRERTRDQLARDRAEREALAAAIAVERERADGLERLLKFERLIGNLTELEQLRRAVLEALPPVVRTRDIWVMTRCDGWQDLLHGEPELALGRADDAATAWEIFPLRAGDRSLGMLGVRQESRPFTATERFWMSYAASVVAVALRNVEQFQELREKSLTDALTGCATRAHGMDTLIRELRRAARSGGSTSVVMLDADHFKVINDTYGHVCGDHVLQQVALRIQSALRATDLPCRYGGEEFLLILPETSTAGAAKVAEGIRQLVSGQPIRCGDDALSVTVSAGVGTALAGDVDALGLIVRADAALYQAKAAGRNRVQVGGEPDQIAPSKGSPGSDGLTVQDRRRADPPDRRLHPDRRSNDSFGLATH